METILESALNNSQVGCCVKDHNKKVLFQNNDCLKVCGDQLGQTCSEGCMELYANDHTQQWKDKGSCVYKNSYMHEQFFDVTVLCSDSHLITFLQPLNDKHEAALAFYRNAGLTKKELAIITAVIQGKSNAEICELLFISKATLKTHLNNVYRKVREQGYEPEHLPYARQMS